jgi:hypothetical protein
LKKLRLLTASGATVLVALLVLTAGATAATLPVATIDEPTEVGYTTVHVSGTVNPNGGPEVGWQFEVSTEPENPFSWVGIGGISGRFLDAEAEATTPQPVGGTIDGLAAGEEYAVRLWASNPEAGEVATEAPYYTFTTKATTPPSATIDPATDITATSAKVSGSVNPQAPPDNPPAFDVGWRFECTPSCPVTGGSVPADSEDHPVSQLLQLQPNTEYEVTLIATNAGASATAGPIAFKTAQAAPSVQTLYAGALGTDRGTLAGRVNPRNSAVTYSFEWGSDTSYGNATPATPQPLGSQDNEFHVLTAAIDGLQPGATYHYRIVATNTETSETVAGADRTFTTLTPATPPPSCPNAELRGGPSANLPDCRAYEQVTPQVKNDQDVATPRFEGHGTSFAPQAAVNGDALGYGSQNTAYGDNELEGGALNQIHVSSRGADGWTDRNLTAPFETVGGIGQGSLVLGFNADLSKHVFTKGNPPLVPGAGTQVQNLYTREPSGTYTLLTPYEAEGTAKAPTQVDWVGGASADMSHVAFESIVPRTPDTPPGLIKDVYETVNGTTRLVAVLPNGEPSPSGGTLGSGPFNANPQYHAISEDGSRIYWNEDPGAGYDTMGDATGRLFLREDGTTTVQVNESQRQDPDPNGPKGASFRMATPDGGIALFTSTEKLTDDSTAGPFEAGRDLYRYEADSGQLTDLTVDPRPGGGGAEVIGVLGMSDDGERVYFAARGVLDEGAVQGESNLYLWDHGATRFIATLSDFDIAFSPHGTLERPVQVTPSGNTLAFGSQARLTAFDNGGHGEVYLWDAGSQQLRCPSCGGSGNTDAFLGPGWGVSLMFHIRNNLSPDGGRLFFETADALVPRDSNGTYDVYEFSDGRAKLISSGQSASESWFVDADASGDDVFFITRSRLVRRDVDEKLDVYDARVGGGFPEGIEEARCEGEGCRPGLTPPPAATAPGTATYHGKQARRGHRKHRKHRRCHRKRCGHKHHVKNGRGGNRG